MTTNECEAQDTCTFDEGCPFHGSCIKVLPDVTNSQSANPVRVQVHVAEHLRSVQEVKPVGEWTLNVTPDTYVFTLELPATVENPDARKTRYLSISIRRLP